ncbi:MAG: hypothetical protein U0Y10_13230 [Spirosomataceae bacterium]
MEPISTAAIASVVGYLAKKLKDNQSIQDFFSDFTEATVNWIRPIFIKEDGTEEKIVQKLKENPESPIKQEAVKSAIASELEDNPVAEKWIIEMAEIIAKKTGESISKTNTMNVIGSGNTSVQDITGSTIHINKP